MQIHTIDIQTQLILKYYINKYLLNSRECLYYGFFMTFWRD